jgi:hypothetical protein
MTRRSRAPSFLWLAASQPIGFITDPAYFAPSYSANDNARPVLALSLDVERWLLAMRGAR